jgi:adenosylcobyric acid synthase
MAGNKVVRRIDGLDWIGRPVQGYEIHMGRTSGPDCSRPMLTLDHVADGAINANGTVMGCYLHGLFDSDRFRAGFLGRSESRSWAAAVDTALDDLARHLAQHVDVDGLLDLAKKS